LLAFYCASGADADNIHSGSAQPAEPD
jgi:hypothetical protein